MMLMDVNWLAVLVGGVIYMIVGATWYSPVLFANHWMKAAGKTEKEMKSMGSPLMYGATFVAELIVAYTVAQVVRLEGALTFGQGLQVGFMLWLGLVVTTSLINHLFAGRPRNLYLIDMSYHLVAMVLIGGLVAAWR